MFDNPYFYTAVVIGLCLLTVVYMAWTAPVGHEDEHGYHSDLEDDV